MFYEHNLNQNKFCFQPQPSSGCCCFRWWWRLRRTWLDSTGFSLNFSGDKHKSWIQIWQEKNVIEICAVNFFLQFFFALLSFKLRRKISYVKWMILCYFCSVFLQECFKILVKKLTKPCFSNNYHYIYLEIKHNVFRCSSPRRIYSVHDWERHQSDAHLHSYAGPSSRLHVHVI